MSIIKQGDGSLFNNTFYSTKKEIKPLKYLKNLIRNLITITVLKLPKKGEPCPAKR